MYLAEPEATLQFRDSACSSLIIFFGSSRLTSFATPAPGAIWIFSCQATALAHNTPLPWNRRLLGGHCSMKA
ncbi:hypothetical protein DV515_00015212 [Chloebia gouldiae]|uniref:Uncharacterized protein n=1 Tax=Chloebia gouldiae TaxID=44316 RepID=A0A3L8RXI0_CHLGU|nr:hypothetical protein DV515_00015212 [Chloebia gouldiae]